jgi:eukaryotic-like serine/threonine-protein kinase
MPPSVGMRFSRYELLSRLGAGGMGEVWRARDHDLRREVAVKFLPEKFAADAGRMGRFAQEARAASSLNHPNIVTIHEIGETSGLPYIVMELVEGQTLRELIPSQEARPLAVRRLLEIGAQIADGLAKAHAAGIVHRDLKPENVMVTADGYVKVLDFGLAKLRSDSSDGQEHWFDSAAPTWPESPSPQTGLGVVLGTAGYMSPEQARGRPVDHRSDQFTLGAILYEMATGRQAFRRETPAQTIAAIIDDPPESLLVLSPALPPPARWVIERCLAKDPGERYASTLDLARELRSLREHLPEVAPSGSASGAPVVGMGAPRGPRWVLLAVLVVLAAALGSLTVPSVGERVAVGLGLRPVPAEKRIAVLPFRSLAPSEEDRALAQGAVEFLTARLAALERFQSTLWVESAGNVLQARVTNPDEARRVLGVTLVVTGSVQRVEGRRLFTVALEDARRQRTLRAATAESLDALADAVVRMLELELAPDAKAAFQAGATGVAEASTLATRALGYTPYAEGRTALERYEQSRNLEKAIELFTLALERDPRYALAHAGLGEAYWRLYQAMRKPEYVALAEQHCERALGLDDLNALPWVTLGMIHAGTGKAEAALADYQKALDRNPRSADAYRELGDAYERQARPADAERAYRRAIELRPGSWANHHYLGTFLLSQGRYAEAERVFEQALALAPDNARVWSNLGATRLNAGRPKEAEEALARSITLLPTPSAISNLSALQFSEGRFADAARTAERAATPDCRDYRVFRNLAAALYWAPGERGRVREVCGRMEPLAREEHRLDPGNPRPLVELADCKAMAADAAGARALLEEGLALGAADMSVARIAAGAYEQIGNRDQALRWLGQALRSGYPRARIEGDPWLETLRSDPRYKALGSSLR